MKPMAAMLTALTASMTILSACPAAHAGALHLAWSGGKQQLTTAATVCTLQVLPTEGSTLPKAWRLIWSSDDRGLQFLPEEEPETGGVVSYSGMLSDASREAHADTALHTARSSEALASARYIIRVHSGAALRLRAVAEGDTIEPESEEADEARLNTGSILPLPPSAQTYVYRFEPSGGSPAFWWPASPDEAKLAITVIGPTGTTAVGQGAFADALAIRAVPNPAIGEATLRLSIPTSGELEVTILDVAGRIIRHLSHNSIEPGTYRLRWDGRNDEQQHCAAGLYFCRLQQASSQVVGSIVLLAGRP